jgi:hypothetical protein
MPTARLLHQIRYIGPCDCHLRSTSALGRHKHGEARGASSDSPDPTCPKCHGEGEIYARTEAA